MCCRSKECEPPIISSDAALIDKPLPGAGQENPYCKDAEQYPADKTENLRSLGTFINFGKLRILDLGDLTRDKEMELMCPTNKIGKIDIYIVSHHGWAQSSSPAFVYGLAPRVAIMDNGPRRAELLGLGHYSKNHPALKISGSCTFPKKAARRTMSPTSSSRIPTAPMPRTVWS